VGPVPGLGPLLTPDELDASAFTQIARSSTRPGLDEIYSRADSTGTKSFLTDALGSTLAPADSSGSVSTSYTYEPFGNATLIGAASSNTFQYTGRENDGTGVSYLRARYYSPGLQRFLSEYLIETPGSSFAYARDLPTMLTDRTGLCWTGFCWAPHAGSWAIHHPDVVVDALAAGCVVATATACTPLAITAVGTTTITSAYKNGIIGGRKTNYGRFAGDLTFTGLTFGAGSLWGTVARNEYYVVSAGDRSTLTRIGARGFFLVDVLVQGARGELGR
jgi:RHS repeat-associated protein